MSSFKRVPFLLVLGALSLFAGTAQGQSIGEVVEDHVEESLEGEDGKDGSIAEKKQPLTKKDDDKKAKKPKKSSAKSKKPKSKKPESKKPGNSSKKASSKPPKKKKKKSSQSRRASSSRKSRLKRKGKRYNFLAHGKKPPRIIGKNFEFDPQVGFGLRGWHADEYPLLRIRTQQYPQWYVGFHGRFFKRIRIYRAFYQSVGLKSPRNTGAVIAAKASKAAPGAATKAMGMMGYQVKLKFVPMIRYEARSYEATAVPQQPVRVIPFDAKETDDISQFELTEDELYAVSTFETFIVGMHYNDRLKDKDGEFLEPQMLPFYVGVGFTQYRKPYQVRVGESVLDELVFNSHFRGAGLALGFDIMGGIDKLGINLATQAGLGQIRLLEDYTLNQALPDDWFMGYLQGDLKVDYTVDLLGTKPTLLLSPVASIGGTSFYYIKKSGDGAGEAPLANWDLLYMAMARLILPL